MTRIFDSPNFVAAMPRRNAALRPSAHRRGALGFIAIVVFASSMSAVVPVARACSQPRDYSPMSADDDDDLAELAREAPIVVSALYAAETDLTPPGSPAALRRQRVDAELQLRHVLRCGFAGCCLPLTIIARDIWLRDCADLRSAFAPRREYVLLLRDAGDGTYRVGGGSGPRAQMRRWFFDATDADVAARARNATCATAQCVAAQGSLCQHRGALPPLPALASSGDRAAAAAQRIEFDNVPIVDEVQPSLASLGLGGGAGGDSEVDGATDETNPNSDGPNEI